VAGSLPGSDDPQFALPTTANRQILPIAQAGWKADLIAGVAASHHNDIVGFSFQWPSAPGQPPRELGLQLRSHPGASLPVSTPAVGKVSQTQLKRQLTSNINVLTHALTPGTVVASRVVSVPVDAANRLFGLEADIRVTSLTAVSSHLGDVVNGLATGLVGNNKATIAGLAINLVDDQGHRAGWWSSAVTGTGFSVVDPVLGRAHIGPVDSVFPNLIGGPPTLQSANGA
jgi:hypothetical protein